MAVERLVSPTVCATAPQSDTSHGMSGPSASSQDTQHSARDHISVTLSSRTALRTQLRKFAGMVPRTPFSCAAVRKQAEMHGIYLHFLLMDILRKELALSRQGRLQARMPGVCTCVMALLSCAVLKSGRHYSLPGHRFPPGQPPLLPYTLWSPGS